MDTFLTFFENLSNPLKLTWIVLCLALFWMVETQIPLIKSNYQNWRHTRTNLIFLATTILINVGFGIATAGIFIKMSGSGLGVIQWLKWPEIVELLLSVMILDLLAQYVVHYLLHKVKFMWRFHMVHHSDTQVNVTTGTRHHPGDFIMRETFALFAIIITGMPFSYYVFYRILTVFFTYFSHANIALPRGLERIISLIFVTPTMHKFHHHQQQPWTDSNYGNMFSIWDRIFGTMVSGDVHKIKYGLDVLDNDKGDELKYQMKVPFDYSIKAGKDRR